MEHRNRWVYTPDAGRRSTRGFTIVEVLVTAAVMIVITALAVPAYNRIRSRIYDAAALSDVVNTAKGLEVLDNTVTFTQMVRGPGRITRVPGSRVSRDVTLLVQRRLVRGRPTYLVRGKHRRGSGATYLCRDGQIYAIGARLL